MLLWAPEGLQTFLAAVGCVSVFAVNLAVLCHPELRAVIAQPVTDVEH